MKRFGVGLVFVYLLASCARSPQTYLERGNRMAAAGKYAAAEIQYRKSILTAPNFAEGYYRLGLLEYQLGRGREALESLHRAMSLNPSSDRYGIELASVAIEAYQVMPNRKELYEQASDEAQFLLTKNPNSFDGLRLRGDVEVIDRKYDEALADFRRADSIQPNDPNLVLAMAQVLFAQNQDREGEDLLRRLMAVRKDAAAAYDLLASHYLRTKQAGQAERLLQSEIAALPGEAHARLQLAALYRDSGNDREMSRTLDAMVRDGSRFPNGPALAGDFYAGFGRWTEALAQYQTGLQRAADSEKPLYHRKMERSWEALGKRDQALAEADKALKAAPKDPDMRLAHAILLRESADPKQRDTATGELKALATDYPEDAVVRYNLALAYSAQGAGADAALEAKKSADLRADYLPPRLLLGQLALGAHDYTEAQRWANAVLSIAPDNAGARLLKVSALMGDKSFSQAETELNSLEKLWPNSVDVDVEAGALATAEKDYKKAETRYQRAYHPGSADLRPIEGLLQVLVLSRRADRAQDLLERDLQQEPDSRPVHLLLASVATDEGKFDLAAQQYRWLQAKDPKSAEAYSGLGDLYRRQGAGADAISNYGKASELAPGDAKILSALAIVESDSGQPQQAAATLNKLLALDPNNATAMNNLAFNLAESGQDLDRALRLAEDVARKYPKNSAVIDTLGWVYTKRGSNQSAIQVLRQVVQKNPHQPAYRYHLAVALLNDKQAGEAKQQFVAALADHPSQDLSGKIEEALRRAGINTAQ